MKNPPFFSVKKICFDLLVNLLKHHLHRKEGAEFKHIVQWSSADILQRMENDLALTSIGKRVNPVEDRLFWYAA